MKPERGVPVPPANVGGRPPIYPFAQMQAGDSFPVKLRKGESLEEAARRARSAAATWRARNLAQISFRVRIVQEGGRSVVRCWMTAP